MLLHLLLLHVKLVSKTGKGINHPPRHTPLKTLAFKEQHHFHFGHYRLREGQCLAGGLWLSQVGLQDHHDSQVCRWGDVIWDTKNRLSPYQLLSKLEGGKIDTIWHGIVGNLMRVTDMCVLAWGLSWFICLRTCQKNDVIPQLTKRLCLI